MMLALEMTPPHLRRCARNVGQIADKIDRNKTQAADILLDGQKDAGRHYERSKTWQALAERLAFDLAIQTVDQMAETVVHAVAVLRQYANALREYADAVEDGSITVQKAEHANGESTTDVRFPCPCCDGHRRLKYWRNEKEQWNIRQVPCKTYLESEAGKAEPVHVFRLEDGQPIKERTIPPGAADQALDQQ